MWIKLHRSLTEWEWFTIPEMVQIFIYLLLKANYEDTSWRGNEIKRGQLVTTIDNISKDTKLSTRKIRTCLDRLIKTNEISKKSTNGYTVITICKYNIYQLDKLEIDKRTTNERQTNDKRTTTYKEIKEINKINNNISLYSAHARDGLIPPDLQDCYNILSSDRSWQEAVLMNLHSRGYKNILFQQCNEYLELFFGKLKAEGTDFKHPRDAKHHFTNWLLIQLEKQKNESNRTTHSRKQEANAYALSQFTDYYANMDEEIPNPFTD